MKRIALTLLVLAFGFQMKTYAQTGFATLPAREKTRLAQEEEKNSDMDSEFQELMQTGMAHFEADRFEEAMKTFEKAGMKRPLNVYPPVMVEDVKLAMTLYEEPEKKEEPKVEPEKKIEDQSTADERVAEMYEKEMDKVRKGTPPKPKVKDPEKEPLKNEVKRDGEGMIIFDSETDKTSTKEPIQEVKEKAVPMREKLDPVVVETVKQTEDQPKSEKEIQIELGASYPDGITEKVFKEGNKEVTQRVVVKNKLGNEYRMVKQQWGGVFYFKNGTSVTKRVWDEETK